MGTSIAATLGVGAILLGVVVLAVRSMLKDKKKGKSIQCGGDCKHCGGQCHAWKEAAASAPHTAPK